MSVRSIILWTIAGLLGFATLSMTGGADTPAMTLEGGLGPEVEVTTL